MLQRAPVPEGQGRLQKAWVLVLSLVAMYTQAAISTFLCTPVTSPTERQRQVCALPI